eukprot:5633352-Amphidinium_carterae.1
MKTQGWAYPRQLVSCAGAPARRQPGQLLRQLLPQTTGDTTRSEIVIDRVALVNVDHLPNVTPQCTPEPKLLRLISSHFI